MAAKRVVKKTAKAAAMKTVAKKPAAKKSAVKKSAVKKSAVKKSAVKKSAAKVAAPSSGGAWAHAFAPRTPGERRYWLVKSEPEVFSFEDLLRAPNRTTRWDGVRNFAARNFLRDGMKLGDRVFYYHSMANPQAIVGICEVVREGYPDVTATTAGHPHFDEDSNPAAPTWYMVDVKAVAQFTRPVTLLEIKAQKALADMALVRIGRLSVTPVRAHEWELITKMAG